MTDVLCPICNKMISGEGIVDLSLNLQEHMSDVHEMKGMLCDLGSRKAQPGYGMDPWTEVREEDLDPLPFEEEAIKEWHGPLERRLPGEDVPQAVRCPFCGEMVRGFALDDFSYKLAKHVNFAHQIVVKWTGKG
jgi:uncharacterized C2H2 Zn-finger protein